MLERLEQIAMDQEGVEKVFAMQAGREIRIMVKPGDIDDIQAQVIARDVAKRVEDELTYPGQIRVTVIRESRAIEFARYLLHRAACRPCPGRSVSWLPGVRPGVAVRLSAPGVMTSIFGIPGGSKPRICP